MEQTTGWTRNLTLSEDKDTASFAPPTAAVAYPPSQTENAIVNDDNNLKNPVKAVGGISGVSPVKAVGGTSGVSVTMMNAQPSKVSSDPNLNLVGGISGVSFMMMKEQPSQVSSDPDPNLNLNLVGGISGVSFMMMKEVSSQTAIIAVKRGQHVILGMDSLTCTRQPDGTYEPDRVDYNKSIRLYNTVFLTGSGDSLGAFEVLKDVIPPNLARRLPNKPRTMGIIAETVCTIINELCDLIEVRPGPTHVSLLLVGACADDTGIFTIETDGVRFSLERRDGHRDVVWEEILGGSAAGAMARHLDGNPFLAHFTEEEAVEHTRQVLASGIEATDDCGGTIRIFSILPTGHTVHTW